MSPHNSHPQGETIFSNYGNKSNEELIRNYGFALVDNSADFYHISLASQAPPAGVPFRFFTPALESEITSTC